jgi:hypothetical protein
VEKGVVEGMKQPWSSTGVMEVVEGLWKWSGGGSVESIGDSMVVNSWG